MFGGWSVGLALCAALWAASASAQVIVDPDPDSDVDWGLRVEPVVSGLESPSALVFFGLPENEEFLVLEEDTGRVRHFVGRVDQGTPLTPEALDLEVDSCGERGLVGIALHPDFDPTLVTTPTPERSPSQDWVYLSYHTDPDRVNDICADAADEATAVLRVERYRWTGTALVDPDDLLVVPVPNPRELAPFVFKPLAVNATTAVGGTIATSLDVGLDADNIVPRLYIAIGSPTRNGLLQNNKLATTGFDDTGVILRLDQNGGTPADNPFDDDVDLPTDPPDPEERYFAYGIRSPRGLVVDPSSSDFSRRLWYTERSDTLPEAPEDEPDEISLAFAGANGGYSVFQGPVDLDTVPVATNPLYPLVALDVDTEDDPVDTYQNPGFSFEDKTIEPTGLAFGGREAGRAHVGALFVGGTNGQLLRFAADTVLGDDLDDRVVTAGDDLSPILVGKEFGAISDVETGLDGSIYVLSKAGAIHRVFSDAVRDLAISSAKVPTRISVSAKKPITKRIRVTLQNLGEVSERILAKDLQRLLGLEFNRFPPANCAEPTATVDVPWYASPPYAEVIGIKPKGKLKLSIDVEWQCDNPSPKGEFDFGTSFDLNGAVIGIVEDDDHTSNNVCPRLPSEGDKGCGGKTVMPPAPAEPTWIPTDIVPK
jgi:glucose/arabinose dehydrogenase